jgi:hypothetical protein
MRDTARILGPGARPTVALRSCRCWGRLANRVHDEPTARALKPDIPVVPPAIEITAPVVLSNRGHHRGEGFWHGAAD